MSILNVWVSPDRALVAVDTHTFTAGPDRVERLIETSKMLVLPHANMVMAMRGDGLLLSEMFTIAHRSALEVDVPVLLSSLVELAETAKARLERDSPSYKFREAEIVVVGWSPMHERIVGGVCHRLHGQERFEYAVIEPWRIGPDANWQSPPDSPDTPAKMVTLARDQVRFMRAAFPESAIGGRLLVAEVTPDSCRAWTQCELG